MKSSIKNQTILTPKSKEQIFFVFKIIIRHIKLGGNIIYVDESTFYTKNLNFRGWRKKDGHFYKEIKDTKKRNLILPIPPKREIY